MCKTEQIKPELYYNFNFPLNREEGHPEKLQNDMTDILVALYYTDLRF